MKIRILAIAIAVCLIVFGFTATGFFGVLPLVLALTLIYFLLKEVAEKERALKLAETHEVFRREFTANVAHELKTPLTAILGATDVMDVGVQLTDEERDELLTIIREQSKRLSSIVKDILSLAEIERSEQMPRENFVPVPLKEVVETAVTLATTQAKAIGVKIRITKNNPVIIQGDAHLLEQALGNLIQNALRYSGSPSVEVSSVVANNHVTIAVTDYGIGIPSDAMEHLFERFYRVDKARSRVLGGTGLGLAIVKHIALLHGGEVSVSSIQNLSTVFKIRLPIQSSNLT